MFYALMGKYKKGGDFILPKDTLYRIVVKALDKKAVKKIFKIKKRNINKPITINIANKKDLKHLVKKIPISAKKLIKDPTLEDNIVGRDNLSKRVPQSI